MSTLMTWPGCGAKFVRDNSAEDKTMTNTTNQTDSSATSGAAVQWRNIQKVVKELAKFCFGDGAQCGYISYGAAYTAVVSSLSAKDGLRVELEPLPAAPQAATPLPGGQNERSLYDQWRRENPKRTSTDGFEIWQARAALTRQAAPEAPTVTKAEIYTLRRLIECAEKLDERPRPMCRDCGDEDGTCPHSGLECDMRKLFATAKALHNKLASPVAAPEAPASEQAGAPDTYAKVLDALNKHLPYPTEACAIVRAVERGLSIPAATTASASGEDSRITAFYKLRDIAERDGDPESASIIQQAISDRCAPAPSREQPHIKTWQERYAGLSAAPNEVRAERRMSACRDAEIADLRAALALLVRPK